MGPGHVPAARSEELRRAFPLTAQSPPPREGLPFTGLQATCQALYQPHYRPACLIRRGPYDPCFTRE